MNVFEIVIAILELSILAIDIGIVVLLISVLGDCPKIKKGRNNNK